MTTHWTTQLPSESRFLPADASFVTKMLGTLGNPEVKKEMIKIDGFQFLSVIFSSVEDKKAFGELFEYQPLLIDRRTI